MPIVITETNRVRVTPIGARVPITISTGRQGPPGPSPVDVVVVADFAFDADLWGQGANNKGATGAVVCALPAGADVGLGYEASMTVVEDGQLMTMQLQDDDTMLVDTYETPANGNASSSRRGSRIVARYLGSGLWTVAAPPLGDWSFGP